MTARAVVAGAGPNGLAAAIRLADAGCEVLVCEAKDAPGGAVRTEELTLPGFHHDTFSAVYPAAAASPVFRAMGLDVDWVHPEICFAHPLPDGRAVALHRSVADTAASLDSVTPGDGERWAEFVAPFLRHFGAVRDTMMAGVPPLKGPFELLLRGGPGALVTFTRLVPGRSAALARRLFEGGASGAWLHGAALHGDVLPDGYGSAIAGMYLNLLGHAVGWPSPRGGAGRITDALVARLEALGGTVRTGARVTRVHAERGRVVGVELASGERIPADVVIADVPPRELLTLAGEHFGRGYRTALGAFRPGASTIKVDWALDGPIPWVNEDARRAGTVHVAGTEAELLEAVTTAHERLPEKPFLLLGQQSVHDPTRAPAGKHTAWAYTHGPAGWTDFSRHVERIEAQVERFAPGFRDLILARHVMDAAELERRNPNLIGGDVGGGSYSLRQTVFRPVPRPSPYTTSLRGLYIGSASAFPGGAVHGIPGDAAARAALAKM